MSDRKRVLFLTDLRSFTPAEVEPMEGIQQFVRENQANWEIHWEKDAPPHLARGSRRFDGVIGRCTTRLARLASRNRIPLVNIAASAPPMNVPSVTADFEAAGRMAAEYFLERGLRRTAFLGVPVRFSKQLERGFVDTINQAGGTCLCEMTLWKYEINSTTFDRFFTRVRYLVENLMPPAGVLGFEDIASRYIAYACEEHGLRVPDDVAIMGVTNNTPACTHASPSLTSIDCNYPLVGYQAAKMLAALMAGRPPTVTKIRIPPRTIVPRQSTEQFFTDDPIVAEALRFISSRHAGHLRIGDVTRHVALSERSLQRRFKQALGHSIVHEIIRQRIRHAQQLLIDGDRLVKQVAQDCGFNDATRFSSVFQTFHGVSPTHYRRLHRS